MRHLSVQQLSASLDGALAGVSRELVMRHLAACASCRERHAGWSANDDALRRVLSWEPDERMLEEWSSRVELTLTAERKGLPAPAFSELQHPVIAPAPEPASDRLDHVVRSVRQTRRGDAANEPGPRETVPSALPATLPIERPETTPADPVGAPSELPVEPESPPIEPVPVMSALGPIAAAVARPPGPSPRVTEPDSPIPAPAPRDANVPPPRRALTPPHRPEVAPLPSVARSLESERVVRVGRSRRREDRTLRGWLAAAGVLLLVLAGSPLVPEVIRIPLPDRWRWRLPRVEFVRRDGARPDAASVRDAGTSLASRTTIEPQLVPKVPIPAPAESVATSAQLPVPASAAADSATPSEPVAEAATSTEKPSEPGETTTRPTKPQLEPARTAPERPRPAHATKTMRTAPRYVGPPLPREPEPDVTYASESPGTIVPTRVTTTVKLSPEPTRVPVPAPGPPTAAEPESEEDWPLLCGTVLDAVGAPVEGARVVLAANALSVRTDRRGRFCVACPPGSQTVRVEATGREPVSRSVELTTGMTEIRFSLATGR